MPNVVKCPEPEKGLRSGQEDIKEFVSIVAPLKKEDRAVLLTIANAFRVRDDIDKAMRA